MVDTYLFLPFRHYLSVRAKLASDYEEKNYVMTVNMKLK